VLKRFGVAPRSARLSLRSRVFPGSCFPDRKGWIQNVRREQMLIKFGGVQPKLFPDWLKGPATTTLHLSGTPGEILT
jgi:hypothetical protein